MDFVIGWSWYLFAFVAGSAVAWAIAPVSIKRDQAKEPAKDEVSRGAR
jgi:uncharacterized membrane protein ArfB